MQRARNGQKYEMHHPSHTSYVDIQNVHGKCSGPATVTITIQAKYVPPQVNAATLATLFVVSGCVYVIFHHNLAASFYDAVFVNEIQ